MGGGDIKLCAAMGLFLGFINFAVAYLIAGIAGFTWAIIKKKKFVPLGTFFALGYFAVCVIIIATFMTS